MRDVTRTACHGAAIAADDAADNRQQRKGRIMFVSFEKRARLNWTCALAVLALLAVPVRETSAQTSKRIAPERVSWNGDPKAPDISGVWVRAAIAPSPGASKEGWLPWPPPLKPAFAAAWKKRVTAGDGADDPVRLCLPPGMPRFDTGMTGPMLIVQTPGRVMLYRDGSPVRRVWLDGRPLPAPADLENFYNGNASGRYEGSDLVTQVIGMRDQPIDSSGVPHSDDLRISEHFHRVDVNTLRVEVTLTDSKAYTKPLKSVVIYKTYADALWEPHEFLCTPQKNYHPEAFVR